MSDSSSVASGGPEEKKINFKENAANIGYLERLDHYTNAAFTDEDLEIINSNLDNYSVDEAKRIVDEAVIYHKGDTCLSRIYYDHLKSLSEGVWEDEMEWQTILKFEAFLINDWSPYPEVRAVTRPIDEEEFENYENIRVYLLSIVWSCAGSVLGTFFAVRFPVITLGASAIQILIAYTGKLFEYIPDFAIPVGFGQRIHFGGGKWNYKEQMLATVGLSTGDASAYSQYAVISLANKNFYGIKESQGNFGFIILLTLASNLMGFGVAGLFRVFLVYPVRMLWYLVLPSMKLSRTLVEDVPRENVNGWKLKGYEFFWIFTLAEFLWYWVTDFLFQFLSTFDWLAWCAPNNNNMQTVAGVQNGIGMNPIPSFDWNIVGTGGMISPFFATAQSILGTFLSGLVVIGMYYMNVSWTGFIPINSNQLYDRFGSVFRVRGVLDSDNKLSEDKLKGYSMPFWSAGNLVVYGSFFAMYPAMLVYALLNYSTELTFSFKTWWNVIRHPSRGALSNYNDRFARAQRKYKEVPEWWYMSFLVVFLAIAIATVEHYSFTNTPVWTIFFGIGLSLVFFIPSGVLYATTNQSIAINVLFELIIGLTNEGNGLALLVSKTYATQFMSQTDNYVTNLKTGHYVGLAPRSLFRLQIINCIINSFVQAGLMTWQSQEGAIADLCDIKNRERFTCQGIRTYYNAAVQWGTIGPKRVLRDVYPGMRYTFLFGALLPLPFWVMRRFALPFARKHGLGIRKEGKSCLRNSALVRKVLGLEWLLSINELVILSGALSWAPSNLMYTLPSLYVGFLFQWYLPRYYPTWWRKYNYLLSAAINVGISYSALIMFFATSYTHIASVNWWGNDTAVNLGSVPRLTPPETGFGPETWS